MKSTINVGKRTFLLSTPETDAEFERIVELNTAVHGQGVGEICRLLYASYPGIGQADWYAVTDPDSGRALSTLCRIPTVWTYRGNGAEVDIPAAELSIVATAEDSRGLGLSSQLVHHYEKESIARGFTLSTIEGIPYYYRKFGYEFAAPLCVQLRLGPGLQPRSGNERDSWRPGVARFDADSRTSDFPGISFRLAGPDDADVISRFYDAAMAGFSVYGKRDAQVWAYLLGPGTRSAELGLRRLIASVGGVDVGYLGLGADGFGPGYAIIEAAVDLALPSTTRRRVAGAFLAEAERERESRGAAHLVISTPRSSDVAALALEYGADDRWEYGWQVKVIDPAGFLRVAAPVLEARLCSSRWRGKPYSLTVGLYGRALRIDWDGGRLAVVEGVTGPSAHGENAAVSCSIPPELLAPVFLGYLSVAEIRALRHDLSVYGDAEDFLGAAFPKEESFVHYFI
jgi:GNAT superfamily N-acetyltransferase